MTASLYKKLLRSPLSFARKKKQRNLQLMEKTINLSIDGAGLIAVTANVANGNTT